MSQRFENGYVALVITCIVGLLCIAIVSWTVPFSKGYQRADQDHQSAYTSDQEARESREECAKKATPQEAIECYDLAVTADREEQRAEQDLDAQQEMANLAEGMLWATTVVGCLTVIVAGLGAYWVKETLSATRDAVEAADDAVKVTREIGQSQTRSYITVRIIKGVVIGADRQGLRIQASFNNSGVSPAKNLTSHSNWGVMPSRLPQGYLRAQNGIIFAGGSQSVIAKDDPLVINPEIPLPPIADLNSMLASGYSIYFWGHIFYDDVFGKNWHTEYCWRIKTDKLIDALSREEPTDGSPIFLDPYAFTRANQGNNMT